MLSPITPQCFIYRTYGGQWPTGGPDMISGDRGRGWGSCWGEIFGGIRAIRVSAPPAGQDRGLQGCDPATCCLRALPARHPDLSPRSPLPPLGYEEGRRSRTDLRDSSVQLRSRMLSKFSGRRSPGAGQLQTFYLLITLPGYVDVLY